MLLFILSVTLSIEADKRYFIAKSSGNKEIITVQNKTIRAHTRKEITETNQNITDKKNRIRDKVGIALERKLGNHYIIYFPGGFNLCKKSENQPGAKICSNKDELNKWVMESINESEYYIKNTDQCLTILKEDKVTQYGGHFVQILPCKNTDNQKFTITEKPNVVRKSSGTTGIGNNNKSSGKSISTVKKAENNDNKTDDKIGNEEPFSLKKEKDNSKDDAKENPKNLDVSDEKSRVDNKNMEIEQIETNFEPNKIPESDIKTEYKPIEMTESHTQTKEMQTSSEPVKTLESKSEIEPIEMNFEPNNRPESHSQIEPIKTISEPEKHNSADRSLGNKANNEFINKEIPSRSISERRDEIDKCQVENIKPMKRIRM